MLPLLPQSPTTIDYVSFLAGEDLFSSVQSQGHSYRLTRTPAGRAMGSQMSGGCIVK